MFQYDADSDAYLAERNGVLFLCEEPSGELERFAEALAACYERRRSDIARHMLPRLTRIYGDLSAGQLMAALGKPQIDLDRNVITYLEHTLDDVHIFEVEFQGMLEEFLYVSIDG
ncbi:MAG: hypothetical protein HFF85_10320 [Oscillibacter sp.]|jgi:hypothetical protein|nr:hypothetical protein [Oscillibacter sp.]